MSKRAAMKVERVPIGDLTPHPENPRQGDVGAISESITRFGLYQPIVVQLSSRYILVGNHRWKAARALGMESMPVVYLDVDDITAKAILVADNRLSDIATYDDHALAELLQALAAEDALEATGYDSEDLDRLLADLTRGGFTPPGADEAPELPEEPESKMGEVYELGPHRLACGDATDPETYRTLLGAERPHLLLTDPPYGVDYEGGMNARLREKLEGDTDSSLYSLFLPAAKAALDPKAALYLFFAGSLGLSVYRALEDTGHEVRALIVWHKLNAHYGAWASQYMPKHEPFLYAHRKGNAPYWYGPPNEVTVWEHQQPSTNEHHPTQKPVDLMRRAIENSTAPGHIVLDPFAGSGSTLIAAEVTGRVARCIELDPRYCDVIRRRYADIRP